MNWRCVLGRHDYNPEELPDGHILIDARCKRCCKLLKPDYCMCGHSYLWNHDWRNKECNECCCKRVDLRLVVRDTSHKA